MLGLGQEATSTNIDQDAADDDDNEDEDNDDDNDDDKNNSGSGAGAGVGGGGGGSVVSGALTEEALLAAAASVVPDDKGVLHCPVAGCTKSFTFRTNLRRHVRSHAGVESRKHACTICGRTFARSDDKAAHERTHRRER